MGTVNYDSAVVQGRVQLDDVNSGDTDERRSQCFDKCVVYGGAVGDELREDPNLYGVFSGCPVPGSSCSHACRRRGPLFFATAHTVVERCGLILAESTTVKEACVPSARQSEGGLRWSRHREDTFLGATRHESTTSCT